jgi:catechol 2,3-dioxygenase-like lactoylglutathione lyase family enzyme
MTKIKHIAIRTTNVEETKAFYQEVFGLRQVGLGRNGVYLSDGHINLAILKSMPEKQGDTAKIGIEHLGFQVEDVEGTLAKLKQLGGKPLMNRVDVTPTDASNPQSYYEIKCAGPDDQIIDISGSGWVGTD